MRRTRSGAFKKHRTKLLLLCCALLIVIATGAVFSTDLRWWQERALLALHPSGEKAFAYAERHFNAQRTADYSIERAQFFFAKAALFDPTLPYLNHELARIEFLKGRFPTALALINMQIALHGEQTSNSYYIRGLIEGYA